MLVEPPRKPHLVQAFLIAFALLGSYAYFFEGVDWNSNSRFDLTRAIVEGRTLSIDAYQHNTGDKALFDGRYYSDKAPGVSLTGVPILIGGQSIMRLVGRDPTSKSGSAKLMYITSLLSVGLASAMTGAVLFLLAVKLGASDYGAAFGALVYGLGTPAFVYATMLIGHPLSAAFLTFALALFVILLWNPSSIRTTLGYGFVMAFAAGWATVVEYPAGPAAAVLAIATVVYFAKYRPRRLMPAISGIALGAFLTASVLALYQNEAFGSPFASGYRFNVNFSLSMKEGLDGVTFPKPGVLIQLLFGLHRGILPIVPLLAVAPVGLVRLWRTNMRARYVVVVSTLIAAYYILLNSSYNNWDGGWIYGPRHLSPALPFLCLGLAPVWTSANRAGRALLLILALYGWGTTLAAVSTAHSPKPGWTLLSTWRSFLHGKLNVFGGWNLGTHSLHLNGLLSLTPLLLFWVILAAIWIWITHSARRKYDRSVPTYAMVTKQSRP